MDFDLSPYVADSWPEFGASHGEEFARDFVDRDPHFGARLDRLSRNGQIYDVLRCEDCRLIHVWPLHDDATLREYYSQQFYQREHTDYLERYEADREWWMLTHRMILCRGAFLSAGEPPRVLDVGTGPGIALDAAKSLGHDTFGLEPDAKIAESVRQRGHQVFPGTLQEYCTITPPHRAQFDVLYAYEVLEHTADPLTFLRYCYALLRPGGALCIVVPNDYNPLQLAAQQRHELEPWWVQPPEHLHYFTPKSLSDLVERCGFWVQIIRGTYPLEGVMLQNPPIVYVGNDRVGRLVHMARMRYELESSYQKGFARLEYAYTVALKRRRIGREIVLICRTPGEEEAC